MSSLLRTQKAICCLFVIFSLWLNLDGAERRRLSIKYTGTPPTLDGILDDRCWKEANILNDFFLVQKRALAKQITFAFLSYDKENLYVGVESYSSNPFKAEARGDDQPETMKGDDVLEIFIAPKDGTDGYLYISLNSKGALWDFAHYPKSQKRNQWNSGAKFKNLINKEEKTWVCEIQIPLKAIGLQSDIRKSWRFNITRKGSRHEKKRPESSSWCNIEWEYKNVEHFGLIRGPKATTIDLHKGWDLNNLEQMTKGMTALLKSVDIYYKAVIGHNYHIPEGTEVIGDIKDCRHVPFPQYSVKADGYLRFYRKTGLEQYRNLACEILDKIIRVYDETKTKEGRHYLLWNNLMAKDGKVYGYDKGPRNSRARGSSILFNQSTNKFSLRNQSYSDAFGQGFFDISQIKDSLPKKYRLELTRILKGSLDFLCSPEVFIMEGEKGFWRTDGFNPSEIKKPEPLNDARWSLLGQDIILMIMAYDELGGKDSKDYLRVMKMFSDFYISGRMNIGKGEGYGPHHPHRIYALDDRMLEFSNYAKGKGYKDFQVLENWLSENIPVLYADIPKVDYNVDGETSHGWSTIPVLEIYRKTLSENNFLEFFKKIFLERFTPDGLYFRGLIQPMNMSTYPVFLDYTHKAWESGLVSDALFLETLKKVFYFYGNHKILRNNFMRWRDLSEYDRQLPKWSATPYRCYVEGVLPEGIYSNAEAQGFYLNWSQTAGLANLRNKYYQFCAPFQYHAERFSYGKADTLCLLRTQSPVVTEETFKEDHIDVEIGFKAPNLPKGSPLFGIADITEFIYHKRSWSSPTNYRVESVFLDGKKIPHQVSKILESERYNSPVDNVKLVFSFWSAQPEQEGIVTLKLRKKKEKDFFSNIPKGLK